MKIKNLKLYKKMFIVVDMVNGFVNWGALHDEKIRDIVPQQIKLLNDAIKDDSLVVFIKDVHDLESVEHKRFGGYLHCIKGTGEEEVIDELKPYENIALSFCKNSSSFMFADGFMDLLNNLESLKCVDIVGCCTDICIINGVIPMMNYFDEHNRDIQVSVHEDAIETYGSLDHDRDEYSNAAKLLMKQQGVSFIKKK